MHFECTVLDPLLSWVLLLLDLDAARAPADVSALGLLSSLCKLLHHVSVRNRPVLMLIAA